MTDQQIKECHEKVEAAMKEYGYHSTFVFGDSTPSFCYSTGVYKSFGIPEIFISALPQNLSHELIANYVSKFKDNGSIPLDEKLDDLTDRFPVYLIEASKDMLKDYVLSSLRFYGDEEFEYVQLVYPDTRGHFPNDAGYDYDQVIVGKFVN
jgi:hypothetical protein